MRAREVGVLKIVPSHLHALLDAQHPADVLPAHALVTGGEDAAVDAGRAGRGVEAGMPRDQSLWSDRSDRRRADVRDVRAVPTSDRDAQGVPLGLPLPNAYAYVLDAHGACVPPGGIGELYLGGPGVGARLSRTCSGDR